MRIKNYYVGWRNHEHVFLRAIQRNRLVGKMPMVGSPTANWSWETGPDWKWESLFETDSDEKFQARSTVSLTRVGVTGVLSGARPGREACSRAKPNWPKAKALEPQASYQSLKLAVGTQNVPSLVGKEPQCVCEVEGYRLDIVGVTSMYCTGSGTHLLASCWILFHSGVTMVKGVELDWDYIFSPCWHFPSERESSFPVSAGQETGSVVCTSAQTSSLKYPGILEYLAGVLERHCSALAIWVVTFAANELSAWIRWRRKMLDSLG